MRRLLCISLVVALSSALSSAVFAQTVSDPVYAYIDRWEARGYLEDLYTLRPYSPEIIRGILERVALVGSHIDAEVAQTFLHDYELSSFSPGLIQRSDARIGDGQVAYRAESGAFLDMRSGVLPGIWVQGRLDVLLIDGNTVVKPATERSSLDINSDGSMNFLPAGLSGDPMGLLYGLSTATWFGDASLWGSASYARSSVGPFFKNGVVIGPQAHAAPNWTLSAAFGSWRFSTALYQMTASYGGAEKYMAYHSYSYAVFPGLDLGIFESAVWGGSFKPLYMVPLSMLFYLQSLSSYGDNSLAGLYASWRLFDGLLAKATVYLDDVGFSDLVAFDLDTKIIGAAQAGLSWAPEAGVLSLASLDYTAIFPYMYAHYWKNTGLKAEDDYTHYGDSFGAALQPNSERWELRAKLYPIRELSLDGVIRLIRHGNASEGITSGDGTWFDDGWEDGVPSYQEPFVTGTKPEYFRFLSQDTIETIFQVGATLGWNKDLGRTRLMLSIRYLLEAAWNKDLSPGKNKLYHYCGLEAAWSL